MQIAKSMQDSIETLANPDKSLQSIICARNMIIMRMLELTLTIQKMLTHLEMHIGMANGRSKHDTGRLNRIPLWNVNV